MRRFIALMCMLLFSAAVVHAQNVLSGTVTDATNGEPLAGVTVFEKGTTNGTFTDDEGKYEITITGETATLVFRFVGYATIEQEGGGNITLEEDALLLDDVVVTAIGTPRDKKALGYSVQKLDGSELTGARDANLVNSLSGKVAGLQVVGSSGNVGSSSRITIRGNSSLFGDNQPLFVVNGIPVSNANNNANIDGYGGSVDYGNVIADINPDDIESITVLKGPNAAALYGSRGANGVIMITTKSGKGGGKKGLGVTYSSDIGFSNPLRLPSYQNKFGQGGYSQFGYYDGNWGGYNDGWDESWGPSFDAAINESDSIDNDLDGQIDEAGEGSSLPQYTGTWGVWDNDGFDNNYDGTVDEPGEEGYSAEPWVAQPDNIKNFFQTGVTWTNNIAISAQSDNAYTRFSYSNMTQTGMVPNTDYDRNTFDVSFGGKLHRKLSMDGNVKYIRTDSKNRPGVGYQGDNVLTQSLWVGRQVDWEDLKENWDTKDHWGLDYNWNHSYENNPYFTLYKNTKPMNRDRVMGYYSMTYDILDWLKVTGRIGNDFYHEKRKRVYAINTVDYPLGYFEDDIIGNNELNSDFLFTATKRFGEKIDVNATFGANHRKNTYSFENVTVNALTVPDVYNVSNANGSPIINVYESQKVVNSVYGSASLGYGGFVYLDLTARNDWSSTLPVGSNSYFYPSATLSFLLSEAITLPDAINLLKVRGSIAQVGSDTDPYRLKNVYSAQAQWNGIPAYAVPNTINTPDLRPERTNGYEAGLEGAFLNNRVGFDFTYYYQLTVDQIIPVDISPSTGATSMFTNAGTVRNSGIELMLHGFPVKSENFSWRIDVNWSKNSSEVVSLADDVEAIRLGRYWGLDLEARVGEPFGVFRGKSALYDDNGNLILDGGFPQVDPNSDEKVLGTITPKWIGGVRNTLQYKGITLSALIDMRQGSDLFSVTYMFGRYAGVLEETLEGRETGAEVYNGHVYEGMMYDVDSNLVANDVPVLAEDWNAFYYAGLGGHDRNIFDGSFIKLREITLSYKLPASIYSKAHLGSLEVGAYGRNVAILKSNVPHIDPETAFGSNTSVQGFEFGTLPSARTFGLTLRASF